MPALLILPSAAPLLFLIPAYPSSSPSYYRTIGLTSRAEGRAPGSVIVNTARVHQHLGPAPIYSRTFVEHARRYTWAHSEYGTTLAKVHESVGSMYGQTAWGAQLSDIERWVMRLEDVGTILSS
ncbi:hypothetical protein GSI_02559 [Ganoderma sinense ZZ0214-1]|uniref:Uncharacterized protein n=1 Tax=Ganoderma sinense ZZ0214-1 TaxID=1077348 RepID=A0A2G8SLY8_9APHY|nr:hypothetical protein GSI_02559 [Ganoderma sinense ZZ0214-1]